MLAALLSYLPPNPAVFQVTVWNSYYTIHPTHGVVYVVTTAGHVLYRKAIVFQPYWMPTDVVIGSPIVSMSPHLHRTPLL